MIRLAVLAPIKTSLYSRLVVHLAAQDPEVSLTEVVVRTPWTYRRISSELRRDGSRLLWKAYNKLVLGENAYNATDKETIRALAQRVNLPGRSLDNLATVHGFSLSVVKDYTDHKAIEALQNARPDVVVFTGGGMIRKDMLDIPTIGTLNCHFGILPPYRGTDVVEWPLVERDRDHEPPQIGLTVHAMEQGLDTGPILFCQPLEIRPDDTFRSIRTRIEPTAVELMMKAIRQICDGSVRFTEQALAEGRQYFVMHPRIKAYAEDKLRRYVSTLKSP